MPFFTSRRERRLWLWASAALLAIYSTLGLAGTLAAALRARNLLNASFAVLLLVAVAAVVGSALRRRPGRREVWLGLGVAVVYGMALVRMGVPEERTHLFEYGVVAVLLLAALQERRRNGRAVPAPAVLAIGATALFGWLDEAIQSLVPGRVYDLRDVGTSALAGLLAVVASVVLAWARRQDGEAGGREGHP